MKGGCIMKAPKKIAFFCFLFLLSQQSVCMRKIKVAPIEVMPTDSQKIFVPDSSQDDSCGCCCGFSCKSVMKFVRNGGLCLLPKLIFSSKRKRRFKLYKFRIVSDPQCGLQPDEDNLQIDGVGALMYTDARKSSLFWGKKNDTGKQAALFRDQVGINSWYGISEKYKNQMFNAAGDGNVWARIMREGEPEADVIEDTVLCGIEMLVRFSEAKEKYDLEGPESCGAGISFGEFTIRFVPAFSKTDFAWTPTVDGLAVNNAFFCEQKNKEKDVALTITSDVFKALKSDRLKAIFTKQETQFKHENELRTVFCATLQDMQNMYYDEN